MCGGSLGWRRTLPQFRSECAQVGFVSISKTNTAFSSVSHRWNGNRGKGTWKRMFQRVMKERPRKLPRGKKVKETAQRFDGKGSTSMGGVVY